MKINRNKKPFEHNFDKKVIENFLEAQSNIKDLISQYENLQKENTQESNEEDTNKNENLLINKI